MSRRRQGSDPARAAPDRDGLGALAADGVSRHCALRLAPARCRSSDRRRDRAFVDQRRRSDRRCRAAPVRAAARADCRAGRIAAPRSACSARWRFASSWMRAGLSSLRPFGAQRRDGVLLAPDLPAQLGDALGLPRRFVLDLVDIGRREHERARSRQMLSRRDHRRLPHRHRRATAGAAADRGAIVAAAAHRCARRRAAWPSARADWRRSRRRPAMTGRPVSMRKVGARPHRFRQMARAAAALAALGEETSSRCGPRANGRRPRPAARRA